MAFYEVTRIMLDPITISVIASGALAAAITLGIAGCVLYKKTREWYAQYKLRPVGPIRCDSPIWCPEIYSPKSDNDPLV